MSTDDPLVGKTLGPYEITERIGAGGMGAVYRARDKSLEREIAIKVLPQEFALDPERLARFRQEARLLAGVNHPNIAAIHGLEHIDGVRFFAQELVRGHTLATIIKERSLELDEALEYARQVADALEAAHTQGVIHRDLKPHNIMVTDGGRVKVLDFGLARPVSGEEEGEKPTGDSTPTISTVRPEGVILGTASYMSPDQARGRNIDHRGDIWAFGCVLYETLARKKAFEGTTLVDTLAAVVRAEPDWDALPPDTPPRVIALIRRCLKKKLRDRVQHVGDIRIELGEILAEPALGRPVASLAGDASDMVTQRGYPFALVAGAALGAAMIGAMTAVALIQATTAATEPPVPVHASLTLPEGDTLITNPFSSLAISPDGKRIAYAAGGPDGWQLYLQDLREYGATPISGTAGATNPFFSPDGEWIGFFLENQALMKVPVAGGAAFKITDVPTGNAGAAWLRDDRIVFANVFTGTGLMVVQAAGGEPSELTTLDVARGEDAHGWPQAIVGNRLLFTVSGAAEPEVWLLNMDSGERTLVYTGPTDARYVPSGHLLFSREGALFAVEMNEAGRVTSTSPTLLFEGMFSDVSSQRTRYAVAADGTLVYVPGEADSLQSRLVWVDRDGTVEPLRSEGGLYAHPRISPDGRSVAVDRAVGNRSDVWVYDLGTGRSTRITRNGYARMPVWSPDGRQLMFASNEMGAAGVYWKSADGSGEPFELFRGDYSLWPRSWTVGEMGSAISYYELSPSTGRDIWIAVSNASDVQPTEPRVFLNTGANEKSPVVSPDGRWLAYVSDESGRDEVYVQSIHGEGQRWTVSANGGREPVWARDGSELFYRVGNRMMAVPVQLGDEFFAGTPELLFEREFVSRSPGFNQYYDAAPDGARFLMIQEEDDGAAPDHLHVIVNFAVDPEAGR